MRNLKKNKTTMHIDKKNAIKKMKKEERLFIVTGYLFLIVAITPFLLQGSGVNFSIEIKKILKVIAFFMAIFGTSMIMLGFKFFNGNTWQNYCENPLIKKEVEEFPWKCECQKNVLK